MIFIISLAILPACRRKNEADIILSEKGIINDSEAETYLEEKEKLAIFWKNLPNVENTLSPNLDEKLYFDDYLNLMLNAFDGLDYGNAYGLTSYLCSRYNLCDVEKGDFGEVKEDELYYLDLSEPLFDERITEYDAVVKVKAIAERFAEYVVEKYGIERLVEIAANPKNNEIVDLKNEWLQSMGHEYKYEACSTIIIISDEDSADEYPYYTKSDSYTIHFALEDINKIGYQKFFGEFSRIEPLIETDFSYAREAFWKYDGDVEPVDIYTCFTKDNSLKNIDLGGAYYDDEDLIRLYVDWKTAEVVLVHEYIHYLDKDFIKAPETEMVKKRALLEAYASEVSTYECPNKLMRDGLAQYGEMDYLKKLGIVKDEEVDSVLYTALTAKKFLEGKGIEIVSATGSNNVVVDDVVPWDYLPAQVNGSFFHFLMEKYGKETIWELTYNTKDFDKFISDDYENLYREWVLLVMSTEI